MKKVNFFLTFLLSVGTICAQPTVSFLPTDKNVHYGKLANGLTYYIRSNPLPQKRACFYFVQKTGSMQEEDSQSGLAHFLEHMAFNGSQNFPGRKTVVSFVENNGGQFGQNINAYTSYDETVYSLSDIILTNSSVVDTCLLILHDWSGFLTLDNAEIDKERAIIKEEWRTRNDAQSRISNQLYSVFFNGSNYAKRSPIGNIDVVENFKYQELRDYYHNWYRPDLQAIVVVGDVDADSVEKKLRALFANIPAAKKPVVPCNNYVPDNEKPQIALAADPEATSSAVAVFFKQNIIPDSIKMTENAIYESLLRIIASQALSNRLSEAAQTTDAPFSSASSSIGNFLIAATKDAWNLSATPKNGKIKESLAGLLRESERVYKYGFTIAEIERVKKSIQASYDNLYNNRNKQASINYVNQYTQHFLTKAPITGIEFEYDLVKRLLKTIGPKELNDYVRSVVSFKNMAIAIAAPSKDDISYPSEQNVQELIKAVREEKIQPYKEKTTESSLMSKLPKSGKIIKTTTDSKWNTTNWTLSNGIIVVLKKTDYKDDYVTMTAVSKGGILQFPYSDAINAGAINEVVGLGGLSSLSNNELKKILVGKSVSSSVSVSLTTQGIKGQSSVKDLETLFQIVYLQLMAPRKDQEAYSNYIAQLRENLQNACKNPYSAMNDTIVHTLYGVNPFMRKIKPADIDKLDYNRIMELYKTCFSNNGSMTFTFVGTFDEDAIRPLVEQYLAALPKGKPLKYNIKEDDFRIKPGQFCKTVKTQMQTPKASLYELYSGNIKRTPKNILTLNILKQVLETMFSQNLREDNGGAYIIRTNVSCSRFPEGQAKIEIMYDTDTSKLNTTRQIVQACISHLAKNTIPREFLDVLVNYTLKEVAQARETDGYRLSVLSDYYLYGEDYDSDYDSLLRSITPDEIKSLINEILDQKNSTEIIMLPD